MDLLHILWALVTLLTTGLCVVLWYLLLSTRQDTRDAMEAARKAQTEAAAAAAASDKKVDDLRIYILEKHVTKDGLNEAVSSLKESIKALLDTVTREGTATRDSISEMHRRIDSKADKP